MPYVIFVVSFLYLPPPSVSFYIEIFHFQFCSSLVAVFLFYYDFEDVIFTNIISPRVHRWFDKFLSSLISTAP